MRKRIRGLKNHEDLRRTKADFNVQFFKSSGKGGQHRNKRETACRITDKVTGLSAEADEEKSQLQNKKAAFLRLIDKLIDHYQDKDRTEQDKNLGWDERIRTYNLAKKVAVDHRVPVHTAISGKTIDNALFKLMHESAKHVLQEEQKEQNA